MSSDTIGLTLFCLLIAGGVIGFCVKQFKRLRAAGMTRWVTIAAVALSLLAIGTVFTIIGAISS